ncbi:MlaA family lipoprotein [Aquabacterium sp. OR-4]|uniref:MlaA family lipoprotein n=1 Tax=Aquabacterium sp. OR-4 TaxID=2978127 RepID=UPI0021B49E47|nr:VacJ family lipoprotein [Aquabacterium sp. OR-4]MDT7837559.1 VacJ family lipoprotein [Aquabacterium sp. OR-4]
MRHDTPLRRWLGALLLLASLALGGCATLPSPSDGPGRLTQKDPFERFNRHVFAFNEGLDEVAIKPAALLYQSLVPQPLRTGVDNFLGNLGDAWTTVNLFLQAKPVQGLNMGLRSAVNTVFGFGGVLDIAEEAGLERTSVEDLGQTLGRWGVKSGPYLVLPFLGPSTLRDGSALLLDIRDSGPALVFQEPRDRYGASFVQLLNTRVKLLNAGRVLDDIALDKYVLMRDAYLARRRSLIYDGEPPEDDAP